MQKTTSIILIALFVAGSFAGCTSAGSNAGFNTSRDITVVSREDGSGTRGAFIELFEIQEKTADGKSVDHTTKEANITDKTDVMLVSTAGDPYAIGYVSLGSLNDTVKALDIDGTAATVENVKSGAYRISRPFNIATNGEATGLTKDFIDFILSKEGQEVVAKGGYIAVTNDAPAYAGPAPEGKIVIAGSSSVTPIMEKLKEAYAVINPGASIEIQMNDSTTGMNAAKDGICDIGMASRELKDSELETLTPTPIAIDGIAVIVNSQNPVSGLSKDAVKAIFTGEFTKWSQVA